MISPMKKILVVGANTTPETMIQDIAQSGTVHIIESSQMKVDTDNLEKELERSIKVSKLLNAGCRKDTLPLTALNSVISDIESLQRKKLSHLNKLRECQEKLSIVEIFGNRSKEIEAKIKSSGLAFTYIIIPKSHKAILENKAFIDLGSTEKDYFGVLFDFEDNLNDEVDYSVELPNETLSELKTKILDLENNIVFLDQKIRTYDHYKTAVEEKILILKNQMGVLNAGRSITKKGILHLVVGWAPEDKVEELEQYLTSKHYGIATSIPTENEEPPVKLQNSKWLESCQPLYGLINSYPGYKEQDISFSFLAFTCLFFAILVGDAGYGFLTLILTAVLSVRSQNHKYENVFRLGWLFSTGAIIWGAITGNWFGIKSFADLPILRSLVIPQLDAFQSNTQNNIILLCFVIGAIHISIAHIIRFFTSDKNIAEFAWVGVIWSVFLVVRNLVLESPVPSFMLYLLSSSILIIILFAKPDKNIIKRILGGVASVPMKLMNCFADTISYIRLFAVGMATLAVAASFNEIAFGIGFDTPINSLLAILILLMGHGVNIAMAALSVVVHGLRLNMLEFSSHLGIEWSGQLYQPLKSMGD